MRVAAGISAVVHIALIGVTYFGLPLFYDSAEVVMPPVIEVEFVRLDDETKLSPPEPEKEPPPAPAIAKEAPPPEPEPEPVEPEKIAEPAPEAEPEPAVEEPAPPKPVEQVVKPKPKPKTVKRPPPKPKLRPKIASKPPEPKKKQPEFDPGRLVAKLDKKLKERQRRVGAQLKSDVAPVALPPAHPDLGVGQRERDQARRVGWLALVLVVGQDHHARGERQRLQRLKRYSQLLDVHPRLRLASQPLR